MSGVWRGLTESRARTDPRAEDLRLLGRTYAIPFERVWTASLHLAGGGLRRWRVLESDDQVGRIVASSRTLVTRAVDDIVISIGLDENAQTRVDLESGSRNGKRDFGRNARKIGRFLHALDEAIGATPAQILDPTLEPSWTVRA